MKIGRIDMGHNDRFKKWRLVAVDSLDHLPVAAQRKLKEHVDFRGEVLDRLAETCCSYEMFNRLVPDKPTRSDIEKDLREDIWAAQHCEMMFNEAIEEIEQSLAVCTGEQNTAEPLWERIQSITVAKSELAIAAFERRRLLVEDDWGLKAMENSIVLAENEKLQLGEDRKTYHTVPKSTEDLQLDSPGALESFFPFSATSGMPRKRKLVWRLVQDYIWSGPPNKSELTASSTTADRETGNLTKFVGTFTKHISDFDSKRLKPDDDDRLARLARGEIRPILKMLGEYEKAATKNWKVAQQVIAAKSKKGCTN